MTWLLVPLAFAAMFAQDVLCVWLVRAEAQGRAHAAARWDTAGDACRIAGLYAGMDALLLSHDVPLKAAVIAATLAADYLGTLTGVRLGARLEQRKTQVRVTFDGDAEDRLWEWLKKNIRPHGDSGPGVRL